MKHSFSDVRPFRRDPLKFLLDRASGTPAALEPLLLGPIPHYLVTDPQVAREILKADESFIDKGRLVRKLRPLLGDSFLTISGPEHRRRREVLHHQLARGIATRYVPAMSAVIRRLAAALVHEPRFDAHQVTGPLALSLACVALFGQDVVSSGDRQVLVGAMKRIEDDLADEMFRALPLSPWNWLARRRRRKYALADMSYVVQRVRQGASHSSVLRSLEDLKLSDDQIRDEILTMLLAGHHTTGTAGAWILYHLANEPGLADAICAEASAITDDNGEIQTVRLNDAPTSVSLVREVLRLYPSAWWFSREVIQPTTVAGVKLKRGTSLIISPWQIHRDERYWPDPHQFRIDRSFSGTAYLPFGAGPRACVGMGVAMLELQLLALELAAAFQFNAVTPVPAPWPSPSVTLIPPPISIGISLRGEAQLHQSAA